MRNGKLALIGLVAFGVFILGQSHALGRLDVTTFRDPDGKFSLDCPHDWQQIPGLDDVVVTFSQKKGEAFIVVTRKTLILPLAPSDVNDSLVDVEVGNLKAREAKATDVKGELATGGSQPRIIVDFSRPGIDGPERGRLYALPVMGDMYRITCLAPAARFPTYLPVCTAVVDSFHVGPPTGGGFLGDR